MSDYFEALCGFAHFMIVMPFLAILGGVLDKLGIDEKVAQWLE
jgi:hypothetical protein